LSGLLRASLGLAATPRQQSKKMEGANKQRNRQTSKDSKVLAAFCSLSVQINKLIKFFTCFLSLSLSTLECCAQPFFSYSLLL